MIFENTWQNETVLHEAFIDENADVSIREDYDESQFEEEPKTLMDIPKDWEGSSISIGDCLLDLQTHINELYNYFSEEAE